MALNLVQPFVGIFAVRLGASNLQIGLLSSGPALVSLLSMIPGGKYIDRMTDKKRTIKAFVLAHRIFYLLMSTIPFFTEDRRAWLLVFAVSIMNMPASISNIGWQAFISRIIPARQRADAFAARNRWMNLAGTIVVLLTGRLIDIMGFPLGYQVAFLTAFLMTMVEIWVFDKLGQGSPVETGEGVRAATTRIGILSAIRRELSEMISHGPFVRYTLVSVGFYLCWQTAWPLFTLYQVKVLGANNTWVSLLNLANTGGSLVGYGFWAKMLNKRGNLTTLFWSSVWIFTVPVAYAFSQSLLTIACFNLVTGAIFSGVNLGLFNQLLEVTPEGNKATYIAYYTTATNGAAIIAPMLGVALLNSLGFFWAFLATAAMRLLGSFAFLLVAYLEKRAVGCRRQ